VTIIRAEELRILLSTEKHKVSLLIDTGASISTIPFFPGPGPPKKNYYSRHIRPAFTALFHSVFSLLLGRFTFLSLFFNCSRNLYSSAKVRPSI
jgi:hypothetical protein